MIRQLILLFFLFCYFIANACNAKSLSINVYLKLNPNNQIKTLIKEFNQFLSQQGLFATYQIAPYINAYPLHITLYLTNYDAKQIPTLIKQTEILAKQHKPISFFTLQFIPNSSGYLMLAIEPNKELQQLSDDVLNALTNLRDKHAKIPMWASKDHERKALFHQYGSPSIFHYFIPHVSIFSADHLSNKQNAILYQQLKILIPQFATSHQIHIQDIAYTIGIGIADSNGQIIKELGAFKMSQSSNLPNS